MLRLPALAGCLILMAQAADAGTLDRVRETLTIKLGYRADAKPHSYRNDKGEPAGYAVDLDRKSTRLNSSHMSESRMPSSA